MHDFIIKHLEEFIALHPRPEALETPIEGSCESRNPNWSGNPFIQQKK